MILLTNIARKLRQDAGAALVTVLLLVAVMATGAVVTFEALGYSVKRSTARKVYDQARFYALGGEQLAVAAAEKIRNASARLTKPQAVSYPIDGGRIDGVITDVSNCFNVNSLLDRDDLGVLRAQPEMVLQYHRLLTLLGLSENDAQRLSAALLDWIDTDNRPTAFGAEDYDYAALPSPYRTANGLMVDISELNAVRGYDAETIELLLPYLCVGFSNVPTKLNVNTLSVTQAPLLAALFTADFSVVQAAELIASRPAKGYQDIADFWQERVFSGKTISQSVREKTSVKASLFESRIKVQFYEAVSHLTSVIYVGTDNKGQLLTHHFGVLQ
ncbi:MAG: type II secretion system minor pseudopilin GspK [Kordiimonas sp.]